jgi:hypothetical protein
MILQGDAAPFVEWTIRLATMLWQDSARLVVGDALEGLGQDCKPSVACRVTAVLSPDRELRLLSQFAYAAECLLARCDSDPALIGTRARRNFSAMVTHVKNGLNARLVSSLESPVFAGS